MDEMLTLNDGTVIENSHAIPSGEILWVYINGYAFEQVFFLLTYPEKTEKIVADRFGVVTEYDGYTHLFCLSEEGGGMVSAGLKKGVQNV